MGIQYCFFRTKWETSHADCSWDNHTDECQIYRSRDTEWSSYTVYLKSANLMNDIITLQAENHTGSGSVCIHRWCSRGLFTQRKLTALLQLSPAVSHHWPSWYKHHLLCLPTFTATIVLVEDFLNHEILANTSCWTMRVPFVVKKLTGGASLPLMYQSTGQQSLLGSYVSVCV